MLSVEDWAEIRRLRRSERMSSSEIARVLGISRNTVRGALESDGPPKYERKPAGSVVDAFEDAIRAQLTAVPTMPATVIAERVGWSRGMTVFNERVRELRPAYLPPDPAGRTTYDAGDIAQCDLWPADHGPGRVWANALADAVAGVDDGAGILAVALSDPVAVAAGGGSVRRVVAVDQCAGCGATHLVWDGDGAIGR